MQTEIPIETSRTVQFVGDYFCLTITVPASSDEQAIANANAILQDHYGWEMHEVSNEITVEDSELAV
jgi:hypothetical protein